MSDLTDDELPGYCEIHCRTERALFHSSHLNRLVDLAGNPPGYQPLHDGWFTARPEHIDPLAKLARQRIAATQPTEPPHA